VKAETDLADERDAIRENKLSIVERLADDLAHEIRNPLHSMVINLEVMRRRLARLEGDATDDLLRYAGILDRELDRVIRRVDLLLHMLRPYREGEEPTTLTGVLEELRELVALECERHGVQLHMETSPAIVEPSLPPGAVRQLILGLVLDALDSSSPGGTLHLVEFANSGELRLELVLLHPPDQPAESPVEERGEPFLDVARTLADRLGGNLDIHTGNGEAAGLPGHSRVGFILSLPAPA